MLKQRCAGFSLLELMVVLTVVALLMTIGLPGYQSHVRKLRRTEALDALARIQQAQERRRADQPRYADSIGRSGLDMPDTSAGGRYRLATGTPEGQEARAYWVSATALGQQANDQPCVVLKVEINAGGTVYRSGPDGQLGNSSEDNRRCWND
jgi:type IV pilus assembly protein PilE